MYSNFLTFVFTIFFVFLDTQRLVTGFRPKTNAFGWFTSNSTNLEGCWIPARGGQIPPGAVEGGYDHEPLYLARCHYNGEIIPGKLHSSYRLSYIPQHGVERELEEYEILCNTNGSWVPGLRHGNNIPRNAVQAGITKDDEPLYIARARHNGTITPGKFQPSQQLCHISYGGREIPYDDYQVFVTE